jgi:hypothetical protein
LLRLHKKLLPVFTSVEEPWEGRGTRISPATVAMVKELRAGGMKLTKTFSLDGDLVVDFCGGGFTTAAACMKAGGGLWGVTS